MGDKPAKLDWVIASEVIRIASFSPVSAGGWRVDIWHSAVGFQGRSSDHGVLQPGLGFAGSHAELDRLS